MKRQTPYPLVRFERFKAWQTRIVEMDREFAESMSNEQWVASREARLVRRLKISLEKIEIASRPSGSYSTMNFDPEKGDFEEDEFRGAELIDQLVRVTGVPKARIVITGETINRWIRALEPLAKTETHGITSRSPAGVSRNATSTLGALHSAARDHLHMVEESGPDDGFPRTVSRARDEVIELSGEDEHDLHDLVRSAEALTGITAEYAPNW